MNLSLRTSLLLSAALFAACPGPSPEPDAGVTPPVDAGVEVVDAGVVDAGVVVLPKLEIVSPETGTVSFIPEATLEVRVLEAAADAVRVTLNTDAPIELTGPIAVGETRSTALTLVLGVNRIHVELLVGGEVVDEETPVFFVQESPVPLLDVLAPAVGESTLLPQIDVAGRIISSRAISTATVTVGSGAPTALVLTPAPGGFLFSGTAALTVGANELVFNIEDSANQTASATRSVQRDADAVNPMVTVTFPRDGQAVRTRDVVLRGTANDNAGVTQVSIAFAGQTLTAPVGTDGTWSLRLPPALTLGDNTVDVSATDVNGNAAQVSSHVYFGQRLSSGGAHGGVLSNGVLYTFGRNNLGQTGLNFVSSESRTTWCDNNVTGTSDVTICKATSVTNINALCNNPGFVTPTPADSPEAQACRAAVATRRNEVCTAANAAATCTTSNTTNLLTVCDTAYGVGTPSSAACRKSLICDPVWAAGSAEHTHCVSLLASVPTAYPAPATPYTPTAVVVPNTTFVSLSFNQNASSAIDSAGNLWAWGDNASGQLCLGNTTRTLAPAQVPAFLTAPATAVGVSRGYDHVLVLDSTGGVWGCGLNSLGQLGDGTSGAANNRASPEAVQGLPTNIVQVSAGSQSSYAVTADGNVWAWGRNQYGNLGNGMTASSMTAHPVPALVPNLTDVVMLANGRDHVLALKRDGTVWAWGLNGSNQVNGSIDDVLVPTLVMGVTANAVYANANQGFYEDAQGRLFGWGQNGSGNLGIPDDEDQPTPSVPVFGVSNVLDVGIGALQGFAMRGTQVFAWGWSFHGSLGAGNSAIHTWAYRTPVLVQLP